MKDYRDFDEIILEAEQYIRNLLMEFELGMMGDRAQEVANAEETVRSET